MEDTFRTQGGILVYRTVEEVDYATALDGPLEAVDRRRGAVFASGYEYPGRYSRWDIAFSDPPVELISRGRRFDLRALNDRGRQLLLMMAPALGRNESLERLDKTADCLTGFVKPMPSRFAEEERSKQPTLFSALRSLVELFRAKEEPGLGLYGAFGYDLVFQFEPIRFRHERRPENKDAHLFLPDRLVVVDHRRELAVVKSFDFYTPQADTTGYDREGPAVEVRRGQRGPVTSDHAPGEYADKVREIQRGCKAGDFFEVVLSQVFETGYPGSPRELFDAIRRVNPSPYEFLINLGDEQLVGASPEMFVRVEGDMVETCPISGTARRGRNPMEDAEQMRDLLNSKKDEAELTMCTDVDRNDKSRVCLPGSVQLKGRRLIEAYSRLFHTVDHVVGKLRPGFDAFDALLSHMWACTLTGAPKPAAMQRVEDLEKSPREWYGGAVGFLSFNGDLNTGITIRAVHLREGKARVRVGATLLADSDPEEEDRETRLKASAFLDAVLGEAKPAAVEPSAATPGAEKTRILFVDNRDSFVHTLGNYVRQTGAQVTTLRAGFDLAALDEMKPDLVFISPGPGRPEDFGVPGLVKECVRRGIAVFGVCLGLQGMTEAFGGALRLLEYPVHGKPSVITCNQKGLFTGFPAKFRAGRYHSLYADPGSLPACLQATAHSEDGVIMAIEHREYPAAAVQFHPESILTLGDGLGLKLIQNVVRRLAMREK
ncbi:MAG TPA: anthranilate synthase component I [Candidatus Brocadiia bacterium]|nr:anthranilate synthase component I [Candidatus Brocadiia bacterium]